MAAVGQRFKIQLCQQFWSKVTSEPPTESWAAYNKAFAVLKYGCALWAEETWRI